ncbi:MAG: uracil-DNA glycosylase [Burkholderiaceae bacterium]
MAVSSLTAPLASHFNALPAEWRAVAKDFIESPAHAALCARVDARLAAGVTVFPATPFAALRATSPSDVKVVILGQDPYHGIDKDTAQAHGLAFSVPPGVRPPPSLRNIFKELTRETGAPAPAAGDLTRWATQGVLLLNAVLTVEARKPASHARMGWELLTDSIIAHIGASSRPVVFMLWGGFAQKKAALIGPQHLVLKANHPSPLSALRPPVPFVGCGHFEKANQFLRARGRREVNW